MRNLDESRPFKSLHFCWQVDTFDTCVSNLGSRPKWHRGGTRLELSMLASNCIPKHVVFVKTCWNCEVKALEGARWRRLSWHPWQNHENVATSNIDEYEECTNGPMQNSKQNRSNEFSRCCDCTSRCSARPSNASKCAINRHATRIPKLLCLERIMQSWEDQLGMLWCTSGIDSPFRSWLSHRSRCCLLNFKKVACCRRWRILDFSRTSKENIKTQNDLWYYHHSIDITKCFKVFGSVGSVGCFSRSEPSAIALLVHLLERAVASFPNRLLGLSNFDIKFRISTYHRFSYN